MTATSSSMLRCLACKLGRRYGIAKSRVLRLLRQAGTAVRHPRLSPTETALLVELFRTGVTQRTSPSGRAGARLQSGTACDGRD
jgi:hypothetical protein